MRIQQALTALLAVFHAVAVQASSSHALWGPPLEGDTGVGGILHCQVSGLAGGAWAERKPEEGLSKPAWAGKVKSPVLDLAWPTAHTEASFPSAGFQAL